MPITPDYDPAGDAGGTVGVLTGRGQTEPVAPQESAASKALPSSWETITRAPAATLGLVVETVDDTAASLNFGAYLENDDFSNFVYSHLGPETGKFMVENRNAFSLVGGVATVFTGAGVATKVTKVGTSLNRAVAKAGNFGRYIAEADLRVAQSVAKVNRTQLELAGKGLLTGETGLKDSALVLAKRTARREATRAGLINTAIAEGVIAVAGNQNPMLYAEDDFGLNLGLVAFGGAAAVTWEVVQAGSQIRRFGATLGKLQEANSGGGTWVESFGDKVFDPNGTLRGEAHNIYGDGNTDKATQLLLQASSASGQIPTGATASQIAQRNRSATAFLEESNLEISKVSTKGIGGSPDTRFEVGDPGVRQHLMILQQDDPLWAYRAGEIGQVPAGSDAHAIIASHEAHTASLETKLKQLEGTKSPSERQLAEIDQLKLMIPMAKDRTFRFIRQGHSLTADEYASVANVFRGKVTLETSGGGEAVYRPEGYTNQVFGVTNELKVQLPVKGDVAVPLESMSYNQQTALFTAADKAIDGAVRQKSTVFTVSDNPTWFDIDMHLELNKRSEGGARIAWPAGHTAESMLVESLAQKAGIFQRAIKESGGALGAERVALYDTLNLPTPTSFEPAVRENNRTIIEDFLLSTDPDTIRKMPFNDIQNFLREQRQITDTLGEYTSDLFKLNGNSFGLGRGVGEFKETPLVDFVVADRAADPTEWTRLRLQERIASAHVWRTTTLMQGDSAVAKISGGLHNSADYETGMRVENLSDAGLTSSLPFMWNRQGFGLTLTQEFAARDNPTLLAMLRQFNLASRGMDAHVADVLERPLTWGKGTANAQQYSMKTASLALRAKENAASSQMLNNFMSLRQGWDLAVKPVSLTSKDGNLRYRFTLENTAKNRALYKTLYGRTMPASGDFLKFKSGVPIEVDDLGMRYLNANQEIQRDLLENGNQLLRSQGLTPINEQPWHVSPTRLEGRHTVFILNPSKKPVMVIAGNTSGEKLRMIKELENDPDSLLNQPGYTFATDQDIARWRDVWDYPMGALHDPTIPVIQKLVDLEDTRSVLNPFVEFHRWEDNIDSIKRQYERMSRDIVKLNYDPAMRAAEVRSALRSESPTRVNAKTTEDKAGGKNVYDFYLQLARGQQQTASSQSRLGSVMRTTTDFANTLLQSRYDNALLNLQDSMRSKIAKGARNVFRAVDTKSYESLKESLGGQLPFESADEMLRQKFNYKTPTSVQKLSTDFNFVIASSVLRWGELSHGIVNTLSLPVIAPVVIRNFQQQPGEPVESWMRRIGWGSNIIPTARGPIAVPNATKMMGLAARDALNPEKYLGKYWEHAHAHKLLDQEVAEMNRLSRDVRSDPGKIAEMGRKLDKWLSKPSDYSEKYARTFSHVIGIRLAESMGVTGVENVNSVAHTFANKLLGNYSAVNRPGIFNGPIGGSVGLFQTFGWNYGQRLYGYIEQGDMRALATQFALQGMMFGLASEPGYQQFSDLWHLASNNSQSDPYDAIYKHMGVNTADAVMWGGAAVLPMLLGGDGVALATRGDANVRMPIVQGAPAPIKVMGDMIQAVGLGIDQFTDGVPGVSLSQTAEIFAAFSPSRPLSGVTQLFLGHATDRRGNVVSNQVRDGMSFGYKLAGTKELEEAKAGRAYYRQGQVDAKQRTARDKLNRALDSRLRSGDYSDMPEIVNKYFETGGRPSSLPSYLRDHLKKATNQRQDLQFLDQLKSQQMDNVWRGQQLRSAWGADE